MVDAPETPARQVQSPRAPFQNGVRTNGRAFNSPNWRMKTEEGSQEQGDSPKTYTSRLAFSRPSAHVPQAIGEGRRLYVGNMPYTAKSEHVEALFTGAEYQIERIDIAIDPFTGRNPSYCFVDLPSKEMAERAMAELDGRDMLGRPIKIKPGVVKNMSERSQPSSPRSNETGYGLDRWRRNDAPTFAKMNSDSSRRLYVGGLPKMIDQEAVNSNITKLFQGYNVENISKLFTPHPGKRFEPGDHYYLFVDLSSVEDCEAARHALHGKIGPSGGRVKVRSAYRPEERAKCANAQTTEVPADGVTTDA